jgi:hypothetical protein
MEAPPGFTQRHASARIFWRLAKKRADTQVRRYMKTAGGRSIRE